MLRSALRSTSKIGIRAQAKSCVTPLLSLPTRNYNFASESYANSFGNLPAFDPAPLRKAAIEYVQSFDPQSWYDDPIRTVVNGKPVGEGKAVTTVNAFNEENGTMLHSPADVVDVVIAHMKNYVPPKRDLREPLRAIEQELLTTHAPALVGNQALDFKKQDGITEIEESVEANTVERRLNDLLMADEQTGNIRINRNPALIGCVSNFTNFLDLFRKTVRNLELGVPVVVLSRSNTAQHTYRWFQILDSLLAKHGVDAGMLSHASCDVEQQRRIMSANQASPLYFTGSRPVSAAIKEVCPMLMSSTGGPNTMVTSVWNDAVAGAVRMSAAIENSGQCTALRHVVGSGIQPSDIETAFNETNMVPQAVDALSASEFAALFSNVPLELDSGYTQHPSLPMAYKINDAKLPGDELDEKWRQTYVDVSNFSPEQLQDPEVATQLSQWLVHHQPISLAVNGPDFPAAFDLMAPLFEQTGMVVYTVGSAEQPALTAQARPQDAEIFGEFPPRAQLTTYTKFPVVGPSSTPGYDTVYTESYLASQADESTVGSSGLDAATSVISQVESSQVRGYLNVMLQYLSEAARGGREGFGTRTSLWGLQRPPLGTTSVIRCDTDTTFDNLSVSLLPFLATNAHTQIQVSVDPANTAITQMLAHLSGLVVNESVSEFQARCETHQPWNVITPTPCDFSLVGHHISTLFPLGHIKCTRSQDADFLAYFKASPKWLELRN